jgi:hypothetical protein
MSEILIIAFCSFISSFFGAFFGGIICCCIYYIWIRKTEEERLWNMCSSGLKNIFTWCINAVAPEERKKLINGLSQDIDSNIIEEEKSNIKIDNPLYHITRKSKKFNLK